MFKSYLTYLNFFLAIFLFSPSAFAQPKLPGIFSDNMILQRNANVPIWGWAAASKSITIKTSWNNKVYTGKANANGTWKLKVATPAAGGPYTVSISDGKAIVLKNILIGDVWLCGGQSNMEMLMKGYPGQPVLNSNDDILNSANNNIRHIKIIKAAKTTLQDSVKSGSWMVASPATTGEFTATGWYFANLLQKQLNIPIGLIYCNWGASTIEAWMDAEALKDFSEIKIPAPADTIKVPNKTPTVLYNAMVNPILGYGIKGIIWYQGESNSDRPDQYEQLFPAMVKQWRNQWGMGEFPFYYCQIAPFNYSNWGKFKNEKENSTYLRDAQRKSLDNIPNSGMAVLMDVGEELCIHPANKKAGGQRLALLALHQTYGLNGFGYASPLYESMTIKDSVATIQFKNAPNGLTTFGQPLTNFEIAGADKRFYPAKAIIKGNTVLVSAPEVAEPVAVRYAFKDFVKGELFNTEGLPASSFRTDEW